MAIADEATDTADEEEELLALSCVVVPPINKRLALGPSHSYSNENLTRITL